VKRRSYVTSPRHRPHLRVLTLDHSEDEGRPTVNALLASTGEGIAPRKPGLVPPCLVGCWIEPQETDMLKQVVSVYSLCKIMFARCNFEPLPGEEEEDPDPDEVRYDVMNKNLNAWFSQQIGSVLVDNDLDLEGEYAYSLYPP
jgi:hypothetical protein